MPRKKNQGEETRAGDSGGEDRINLEPLKKNGNYKSLSTLKSVQKLNTWTYLLLTGQCELLLP